MSDYKTARDIVRKAAGFIVRQEVPEASVYVSYLETSEVKIKDIDINRRGSGYIDLVKSLETEIAELVHKASKNPRNLYAVRVGIYEIQFYSEKARVHCVIYINFSSRLGESAELLHHYITSDVEVGRCNG